MIEDLGFVGIKILLALYSAKDSPGKMYIRELLREAGISPSTIYRALSVLADCGLIVYEKKYGRKFVILTAAGRQVAEHLYEADRILRESKERRLKELE